MRSMLCALAVMLFASGVVAVGCSDEACHTESGCESDHDATSGGGEGASGGASSAQGGGGSGSGGEAAGGEGGAGGGGGG